MLWKREENIFANVGRQVYGVVDYQRFFLSFERYMANPWLEQDAVRERFQAAGALAVERDVERAPDQKVVFQFLRFQIVNQRLVNMDEFVADVDSELIGGCFSMEMEVFVLEVVEIEVEGHGKAWSTELRWLWSRDGGGGLPGPVRAQTG